jgi:hypothetical protein
VKFFFLSRKDAKIAKKQTHLAPSAILACSDENGISREIVDAAVRVHCGLGPGLFESVHGGVMASALEKRGPNVLAQQIMPVVFEGKLRSGCRNGKSTNEESFVV